MSKTLCDLKKSLKRDVKRYAKLVNEPTHMCRKCGRVANRKKLLCKARKLKSS